MAFTDEQNEQIRKDLIREAQHCGITIGMRKTSVEQLTNSVGISKGSFYKFFDSKELLFFAVLEDIHTECFAAAQKSLQENTALLPTDHVGAVEADSPGLFRSAKLYIGEIENRYLTGEVRRKVIYHLYKLPQVTINNEKVLLHDGETFEIDGIKIECFLVPGHTWGHMAYLIDDKYLFTGDTLWFGADGGYSFISSLAESNKLAVKSLAALEQKLQSRDLHPLFLTGHTGWTDNFEFAFAHKDKLCSPFRKRVPDPTAPYDAYDESDDTEKMAKSGFLKGVGR